MVRTKQTMLAQLIARAVIFALFLLSIFLVVPGLRYLFILFIIANIVLGFINGKRDIFVNIIFVILTPWLFIPVLEYLITVILVVLTGIHLLMFYRWYEDGGKEDKKEEKKKKFHILGFQIAIPIIILIFLILFILFILLILALFAFSTTRIG